MTALLVVLLVLVVVGLVYAGRGYWAWVLAAAGAVSISAYGGVAAPAVLGIESAVVLALAGALGVPGLRRRLVSSWVFRIARSVLPRIGDTERVALEAGTV